MIPGGYILQPRSFDKSGAAKLPPVTRELWFYLLRNVNYKDNGNLKRGQGFFCLTDIQEDLCWFAGYRKMTYSKPQLTKSLRRLCEGNMVATTKATRGVVVTVRNYDKYQDPENYEGNGEGTTKETRKKRPGHTINKKLKKLEEEEEDNTPPTPPGGKKTSRPEDVSEEVWSDFLTHRKAKRAPVTETVLSRMRVQAEKAGIDLQEAMATACERGWQGFKADWYLRDNGGNVPAAQEKKLTGCEDPALDDAYRREVFGE